MKAIEDNKQLTDEELVKEVQAGKVDYFGELMARYETKIMGYLNRLTRNREDARDISQDVFIKVFRNIQSFDLSQRFSPWIYRIAHNEAVNTLKKRIREPLNFFDPEVLWPHPVAADNPQNEAEREELKKTLLACMDDLDEKYREVLVLRYFEDMDYKDIAEVMQLPVVTVGVRLNRGKERLRKIYEEKFGSNLV